jgi:hypothetical protein
MNISGEELRLKLSFILLFLQGCVCFELQSTLQSIFFSE